MIMTPEVIREFGLFRCERMATTLSKKSCIRQYSITLAESIEDLKKLEVSTKWTNMDKRFSPCKGCHVGKAHYEGLETPEWKCQKCGQNISSMGCLNCNREKLIGIKHRLAEAPVNTKVVSMIARVFQRNCKKCGRVFNAKTLRGIYCSAKCKDADRTKVRIIVPDSKIICIECGKEFEGRKGTKLCSDRCSLDRIAKKVAQRRKIERDAVMIELHLINRKCTNPKCTNVYTSSVTRQLFCDECCSSLTRRQRQNVVRKIKGIKE
jgi:hypothetical protein